MKIQHAGMKVTLSGKEIDQMVREYIKKRDKALAKKLPEGNFLMRAHFDVPGHERSFALNHPNGSIVLTWRV